MKRIGQGGRWICCYKLRTMHPYAEYLQDYIYTQNKLQANGKFNDDFRITTWGRFLRKTWIDELPMFVNMAAGRREARGRASAERALPEPLSAGSSGAAIAV